LVFNSKTKNGRFKSAPVELDIFTADKMIKENMSRRNNANQNTHKLE